SRGAAEAVFVDRDDGAVRVIERNLRATHLEHAGRTVRAEAVTWLGRHGAATGPYAAILVDPPYDAPGELEAALGLIARPGPGGILEPGGVVAAKHFWRTPPPARIGLLRSGRERRFGETTLSFLRWADEEDR
ncbi:MAG TPA: RsmD family RNA methyltransferase, partial [Thermoanaerobaculia bacterium]|nr:RsmD family RNA methyltransferase [Thermoanaerobaculia bacterium]